MSTVEKTSVSLRPAILEQLDARGARSTVINRDLERLYTLYRRALAKIDLTVEEACLIVDALSPNGSTIDANSARLLWASIEDACRLDGLDKKWNVDGQQLVQKLQQLNELQCMAIADAAERFWFGPDRDDEDIREIAKQIFAL